MNNHTWHKEVLTLTLGEKFKGIVTGASFVSFTVPNQAQKLMLTVELEGKGAYFTATKLLDGVFTHKEVVEGSETILECSPQDEFFFTFKPQEGEDSHKLEVEVKNILVRDLEGRAQCRNCFEWVLFGGGPMPLCHHGQPAPHGDGHSNGNAANDHKNHAHFPAGHNPRFHEIDNSVFFRTTTGLQVAGKVWKNSEHVEDAEVKIMALHGFMDNCCTFDLLAPKLLEYYKDVSVAIVALDFAGHGWSQHRPGHLYPFSEWAYDVIDVSHALGWKQFNLLGHSMGGQVSIMIGAIIPGQIQKIILIDMITPSFRTTAQTVEFLQKHLKSRPAQYTKKHLPQVSEEAAIKRSAAFNPHIEELSLKILQRRGVLLRKLTPEQQQVMKDKSGKDDFVPPEYGVYWSYDPVLSMIFPSPERFCMEQNVEVMKHVTCPVFIAWGTGAKVWSFDDEALFKFAEAYPNKITKLYAGYKHHFHLDLSTAYNFVPDVHNFLTTGQV